MEEYCPWSKSKRLNRYGLVVCTNTRQTLLPTARPGRCRQKQTKPERAALK